MGANLHQAGELALGALLLRSLPQLHKFAHEVGKAAPLRARQAGERPVLLRFEQDLRSLSPSPHPAHERISSFSAFLDMGA